MAIDTAVVEFIILGRVVRGRGLVGVTYVGVAYSKWIVVVLLCSCQLAIVSVGVLADRHTETSTFHILAEQS